MSTPPARRRSRGDPRGTPEERFDWTVTRPASPITPPAPPPPRRRPSNTENQATDDTSTLNALINAQRPITYAPAPDPSSSISPRTIRSARDQEQQQERPTTPVQPHIFVLPAPLTPRYTIDFLPPPRPRPRRNAIDPEDHPWVGGTRRIRHPRSFSDRARRAMEEMEEDIEEYSEREGWVRVSLSLAGSELLQELGDWIEREINGVRARRGTWAGVYEVWIRQVAGEGG